MDLKTVKFELYNAGLSNAWPAIVMLLQIYVVFISVANRGRSSYYSLGQPKRVHSSARVYSKYWRSEPVPKPLLRAHRSVA